MDDLDDRERIEEHVNGSGAFLLLLSKGYLTSRLPLREVRHAIHERTPSRLSLACAFLHAEYAEPVRRERFRT